MLKTIIHALATVGFSAAFYYGVYAAAYVLGLDWPTTAIMAIVSWWIWKTGTSEE
jgi:hypothetical protein